MGTLIDRVHRELTDADLEKITATYHAWRSAPSLNSQPSTLNPYKDLLGFCKSATTAEIAAHGHVLTPGRYVDAEEVEDDGDPFEEKMPRQVVDCVGGGTPSTAEPKYWEGGTHHWTTPKDFSSLQPPVLLDTDRKLTDAGITKISSGLLAAGTLLLSSRAPVGYLAIAAMPVAINQGFIALKCNDRASNFFMLNWCQTNMAEIESRATGTTFAEISKQNFRPIKIVLPPKELMAAFSAKVAPLYAQITANLEQSRTLATLRDTLLPKLLSGELSVAEASIGSMVSMPSMKAGLDRMDPMDSMKKTTKP